MTGATRPIRLAMVGGGPDAFIGPIHKMAAELDGRFRLVAGAFSRDAEKSRSAARGWALDEARGYPDFQTMIAQEAGREDGVEAVAIVTPNHLHLPVARAALAAGLHVISDKPATATLAEALELRDIVGSARAHYALTYTYTGYAMIRQAREMVERGVIGRVRKVVVEYSQGWLATGDDASNKQAAWRVDPHLAGAGGCSGDIGVHAFDLVEFVTGIRVESLCVSLSALVEGRVLDDDCNALMKLEGGAPGVLVTSQVATGDRNGLRLRVYGEKAGLDWSHEQPDRLIVNPADGPTQILHSGAPYLGGSSLAASRLPTGHPEGFIEAFATLYRDFADLIQGRPLSAPLPDIDNGVRSLAFVTAAVRSSSNGSTWVSIGDVA